MLRDLFKYLFRTNSKPGETNLLDDLWMIIVFVAVSVGESLFATLSSEEFKQQVLEIIPDMFDPVVVSALPLALAWLSQFLLRKRDNTQ